LKALEDQNLKNPNDERLQVAAARQDPARFAELYENNFERVYAYIARRVRNREEAHYLNGAACRSWLGSWGLRRTCFRIAGSARQSSRRS
jgi:hypothetical protein